MAVVMIMMKIMLIMMNLLWHKSAATEKDTEQNTDQQPCAVVVGHDRQIYYPHHLIFDELPEIVVFLYRSTLLFQPKSCSLS